MQITAPMFKAATGHEPMNDDLQRCNCEDAGEIGHSGCGWDKKRNMPNFMPGDGKCNYQDFIDNHNIQSKEDKIKEILKLATGVVLMRKSNVETAANETLATTDIQAIESLDKAIAELFSSMDSIDFENVDDIIGTISNLHLGK